MDMYNYHLLIIFISVMASLYHKTVVSYETCCAKSNGAETTVWCNGSILISCDRDSYVHIIDYSFYQCGGGVGGDSPSCSCNQTNTTSQCSSLVTPRALEPNISSCESKKECIINETLCTSGSVKVGRVVVNYTCTSKTLTQRITPTTLEVTATGTTLEMTTSNSMFDDSTQNSTKQDTYNKSMEPSTFISTTDTIQMSQTFSDNNDSVATSIESSGGFISITTIETSSLVSLIPTDVSQISLLSTIFCSDVVTSKIVSVSATSPAIYTTMKSKNVLTKLSSHQETTANSTLISPTSLVKDSSFLWTSLTSTISSEVDNKTMQYDKSSRGSEVTLGVTVPVTCILIIVIVLVISLRLRKRAIRKKQYKTMLHHALFNIDYNAHTEELAIENPMASEVNGLSNYSEIQNINPTGAITDDTVETGDYNTINLKTFAVRSDPTYGHLVHPDDEIDTTYDCVSRKQKPVDKDDTYAHIGKSYNQANRRKLELSEDSTYNTLDDIVDESNGLPENAADTGDNVYDHANNVAPENKVSVKPGVTLQYDDVEINFTNDDFNAYKLESQRDEDINLKRDVDNNPEVVEEEKSGADTDEEKHTYFILEKTAA